ncbi:MAG: hypothetical protein AAF065_04775 [Verrucomicrobiota bacterium]
MKGAGDLGSSISDGFKGDKESEEPATEGQVVADSSKAAAIQTTANEGDVGGNEILYIVLTALDNLDGIEQDIKGAQATMLESLNSYMRSNQFYSELLADYVEAVRLSGVLTDLTIKEASTAVVAEFARMESADELPDLILKLEQSAGALAQSEEAFSDVTSQIAAAFEADPELKQKYAARLETLNRIFTEATSEMAVQSDAAKRAFRHGEQLYRRSTAKLRTELVKLVVKIALLERMVDDVMQDPRVYEAIVNAKRLNDSMEVYSEQVPVFKKSRIQTEQIYARVRSGRVATTQKSVRLRESIADTEALEAEIANEASSIAQGVEDLDVENDTVSADMFLLMAGMEEKSQKFEQEKAETIPVEQTLLIAGDELGQLDPVIVANLEAADAKLASIYPIKSEFVGLLNECAFFLRQNIAYIKTLEEELYLLDGKKASAGGSENELEYYDIAYAEEAAERIGALSLELEARASSAGSRITALLKIAKKDALSMKYSATFLTLDTYFQSEGALIGAKALELESRLEEDRKKIEGQIDRLKGWRNLLKDQLKVMALLEVIEDEAGLAVMTEEIGTFAEDLDAEHDAMKSIFRKTRSFESKVASGGKALVKLGENIGKMKIALSIVKPRGTADPEPREAIFASNWADWEASRPDDKWPLLEIDLDMLWQAVETAQSRREIYLKDLLQREEKLYGQLFTVVSKSSRLENGIEFYTKLLKQIQKKPSDASLFEGQLREAWKKVPVENSYGRSGPFADARKAGNALNSSQSDLIKELQKIQTKTFAKVQDWPAFTTGLDVTFGELDNSFVQVETIESEVAALTSDYAELLRYLEDEHEIEEFALDSLKVYAKLLDPSFGEELMAQSKARIEALENALDKKAWFDRDAVTLLTELAQAPQRINGLINILEMSKEWSASVPPGEDTI